MTTATEKPVRTVVDSSVLLPVLANDYRECHWLVTLWDEGRAIPLVNNKTTQEIQIKLYEWSPTPKPLQAQQFVRKCMRPYERNWEIVPLAETADNPKCRDTNDQMFIDIAYAGHADFLIAGDSDLLTMDGQTPFRIIDLQEFRTTMEQ